LETKICWNDWGIQAFFRPDSLERDIRRRITEAWGLKKKNVYLIVNGHGSGYSPEKWPLISNIRVVVKGSGGAEVVIQGTGGWEIELDATTAKDWLWRCGLCQAEIEGWTYHTTLHGGERIRMLKNPSKGIVRRESIREEEGHMSFLERRFQGPPKERNMLVNVKRIDQSVSRPEDIDEALEWAVNWISQNGIGSITRGGNIWRLEQFKEHDVICAVKKIALPILLMEEEHRVTERKPAGTGTERRTNLVRERQTIDADTLDRLVRWGY
jgi:hypothetical protein